MSWIKRPAIEGELGGCLCCGGRSNEFGPEHIIAVGFGEAGLYKDGTAVYREPREPTPENDYMTGKEAEAFAAEDPDHDWQIVLYGPLSGRTYQRHEAGKWVLIEQNEGFA